jgi:L-aminopeptidase/D-esterase-like protein
MINIAFQEIPFSAIDGIQVGHVHDTQAITGCTVVVCEKGATAGVDVRGGAPGTRETDLLRPGSLVEKIHAVFLTGGSAFGLDAAGGIMQFLEEKEIGFDVQVTRVPIVCGAVLFDLQIGDATIRPDHQMGYQACLNANSSENRQGNVGAGMGATVGKLLGPAHAMKGGIGSYAIVHKGLQIGALVAVNALGDIVDWETGEKLAGIRDANGAMTPRSEEILIAAAFDRQIGFGGNTTIGVIATNAKLDKAQVQRIAGMAHDGLARTQRPAHTLLDGDTLFTMATGTVEADVNIIGVLAARVVEQAVYRAVKAAQSMAGLPAYQDFK